MNKEKLLTVLVVLLLILNLVLLGVFMFAKGGPPERQGPPPTGERLGVSEMFDFNENQMAEFEKSRRRSMDKMRNLDSKLAQLSTEYYIGSTKDDFTEKDFLLEEINKVNNEIYSTHAAHFADLKALCEPDQISKLELFIKDLISRPRMNRPENGRQGPPRPQRPEGPVRSEGPRR